MSHITTAIATAAARSGIAGRDFARTVDLELTRLNTLLTESEEREQRLTVKLEAAQRENQKLQNDLRFIQIAPPPSSTGAPKYTEKPEEVFYRVGDRFASPWDTSATHVFAQTGEAEVNLIELDGGNRMTKPMKVISAYKVPKAEFDAHFSGPCARVWKKVRKGA
jgi:hypothetical protein